MDEKQPDSMAGLGAARNYARWHIGDGSWANLILRAYLNPETVAAELAAEMEMGDQ